MYNFLLKGYDRKNNHTFEPSCIIGFKEYVDDDDIAIYHPKTRIFDAEKERCT